MHRTGTFAFALVLLVASPAAAQQTYESSFRFGLGLDYGGLAGRGDGGAGGLRLQLGARVHDNLAVLYQGQALVGVFVGDTDAQLAVRNWNAAMVEAIWGIFSLAAGPSFDVGWGCTADAAQAATSECGDFVAPGLAARAGVRFGVFTLSGDLHVSFTESDPEVWVLAGLGVQLGDIATEPMLNPDTTDRGRPSVVMRREQRRVYRPRRRTPAEELDEPGLLLEVQVDAPTPETRALPSRMSAPSTRRFSSRDVDRGVEVEADTRDRGSRSDAHAPEFDALETEGSDDPLEGLPTR
ncbi:MAG: hypothetical protein AB8I08_01540 [Sandaracinaceae bacterium]